jgi:hypothetical protein
MSIRNAVFSTFLLPLPAIAAGITGIVSDERDLTPIENIEVRFFDAVNATLETTGVTGATGFYNSGSLPNGVYRIRFQDPGLHAPGFYIPTFAGAGGADDFCAATAYAVTADAGRQVDASMSFSPPVDAVKRDFNFQGTVSDGMTSLPLEGITVEFKDGVNGSGLDTGANGGASVTTDSSGHYRAIVSLFVHDRVKVRFSDSTGRYFPEYAGTSPRADDFCLGGTFFNTTPNTVDAYLEPVPVDQQVQGLMDAVNNADLPKNIAAPLSATLVRTVDLLTDDISANDKSACAQIDAFASLLNIQEATGRLSAAHADALGLQAESLKTELGC